MLRQSAGSLRAARSLQAAVIVVVAMLPLTSLATQADARRRHWDTSAPTAPTNLAATAGDSVAGLTWSASTDNVGVAGYRVYRGGAQIASVIGTTLTYSDTGVVNGTTYSYTVKAVDAAGNVSAASNTATVTPEAASDLPSAPPPTLPDCSQQPFCGDYETGDGNQWTWRLHEGTSSFTAITNQVAQGRYAGRFTTGPSTVTSRWENTNNTTAAGATPGQEWFYAWHTMFPGPTQSWWNKGAGWNDFTQLNEVNGSRWIYMGIDATLSRTPYVNIYLSTYGGNRPVLQLQYDHWYQFVVHVKWATDSTGLVELYENGQKLYSESNPTLPANNAQGYWSQGFYTGAWNAVNTVIHDGACRAATYAAAVEC